ncbi:hypothetical protein KBZ14_10635 [Synechococcus sp. HJ21-Hayes]|jgi:hypothetical protein|uniref:hypothetical protein n=1 Tax=unclassified Synechococcus TaxID=2626047 RepID=UPI0020CEBB00|nr:MULTISPECIES: hypothetical protein [unclassified Synechococcus]MCP9831131.1 hypothetical protein [Synechococcus sp. JJ3a-Johnson]MCP9853318.1 hypothetical protein [Synechococcus sp. HJ21-Hayes]
MREAIFDVVEERPGAIRATSSDKTQTLTAPSLEELRHDVRELLMATYGDAHVSVRVRLRRPHR